MRLTFADIQTRISEARKPNFLSSYIYSETPKHLCSQGIQDLMTFCETYTPKDYKGASPPKLVSLSDNEIKDQDFHTLIKLLKTRLERIAYTDRSHSKAPRDATNICFAAIQEYLINNKDHYDGGEKTAIESMERLYKQPSNAEQTTPNSHPPSYSNFP